MGRLWLGAVAASVLLSVVEGASRYDTVLDPMTGHIEVVPRRSWWRLKNRVSRTRSFVDPMMTYTEIVPKQGALESVASSTQDLLSDGAKQLGLTRKPWWRRNLRPRLPSYLQRKKKRTVFASLPNPKEVAGNIGQSVSATAHGVQESVGATVHGVQEGVSATALGVQQSCAKGIKGVGDGVSGFCADGHKILQQTGKQFATCARRVGQSEVMTCLSRVSSHVMKTFGVTGKAALAALAAASTQIAKMVTNSPKAVALLGGKCLRSAYHTVAVGVKGFNNLPPGLKVVFYGAVLETAAAAYLLSQRRNPYLLPQQSGQADNTTDATESAGGRRQAASDEDKEQSSISLTQKYRPPVSKRSRFWFLRTGPRWPYAAIAAITVAAIVIAGERRRQSAAAEDEDSDLELAGDGSMHRLITPISAWYMEDVSNVDTRPLTPRSKWYTDGVREPRSKHEEFRIGGVLASPELRGA
mmetsp:Transcript_73855/g.175810  ORF Transcript_73855/g.175810 Transcript_73855/m.175810 type:complete len:470 (+) Transcript_73855:89-1498(+)